MSSVIEFWWWLANETGSVPVCVR